MGNKMSNNFKIVVMDSSVLFFSGIDITLKSSHRNIELAGFFKTKNDLCKYICNHRIDMLIVNFTYEHNPFKAIKEIIDIKNIIPTSKIFVYTGERDSFLIKLLFDIGVSAIVSREEPPAKLADFVHYARQGELVYSQLYGDSLVRDNLGKLTDLELDVLVEFHNGTSLSHISQMFHKSIETINNNRHRAVEKLGGSHKLDLLSISHC